MSRTHFQPNLTSKDEGFVLQVVLSLAVLAVFAAPVALAALGG